MNEISGDMLEVFRETNEKNNLTSLPNDWNKERDCEILELCIKDFVHTGSMYRTLDFAMYETCCVKGNPSNSHYWPLNTGITRIERHMADVA